MHPVLFELGSFKLYTYGVLVAVGVLSGLLIARRRAAALGLEPERIWTLGILGAVVGLLCAKLWLVLAEFRYYSANPAELFSLRTLVTGGTFYGSLAGASLVLILYAWRHKISPLLLLDIFAPGTALGQSIGRLGCFAAGCCYGKPGDVPWALTFTNPIANDIAGTPLGAALHPAQLYESACDLAIFLFLLRLIKRQRFTGEIFSAYVIFYGLARGIIEFFRGDPDRGLLAGGRFSFMQMVSIFLALLGLALLFRQRQKHKLA
jgi:phosphatidylglycerol:prolipoprotein diacylglycerol transferase